MECSEIRSLLSEYIDNALDPGRRKGVEDHLKRCKGCSDELASLRAVAESLDSLEPVKAPKDFLEGVHARIEQRSWFRRAISLLFVPAGIKIPLECAGVLATAVLVILLMRGPRRTVQFARAPSPSDFRKAEEAEKYAGEMPDEIETETARRQEIQTDEASRPAADSVPQGKDVETMPPGIEEDTGWEIVERGERIELALVLKQDESEEGYTSRPDMAPMEQKRSFGAARPSVIQDQPDLTVRQRPMAADRDKTHDNALHRGISGIMASIEKTNGRYVSTEYDEQTRQPSAVLAEVPSENYGALVEELTRIGSLDAPSHPEQSTLSGIIRVRIKLIQPAEE
jgi:hypothetical protein